MLLWKPLNHWFLPEHVATTLMNLRHLNSKFDNLKYVNCIILYNLIFFYLRYNFHDIHLIVILGQHFCSGQEEDQLL